MTVTVDAIRNAAAALQGEVVRTPSVKAPALSRATGAELTLKLENLQVTGSFKPRGAGLKLRGLDDGERARGVVAASAGNHAQGVAWHAQRLGIPATIFMPKGTPFTKVGRTEALGASVVLEGAGLKEAREAAGALCDKQGATFVHPYDDEAIITGQGTVGTEILADDPDLDALIVPIGGGGLAAGIAIAARALNPKLELIGVEAESYPSMARALGQDVPDIGGPTVAEGIAVKVPGELTKPIIEACYSDILLVDEAEMEQAAHRLLDMQRVVAEGAGAAPLAALIKHQDRFEGRKVGLVISGGNMDSRIIAGVLMRGLVREGRMVRLRILISDAPGVLAKVSGLIGEAGGNIVEVYHQRLFNDVPVKQAEIDVMVETLDADHVAEIQAALKDAGFPSHLMNESSVGGQAGIKPGDALGAQASPNRR